jgi:Ni,Fe-hydrogenase III large subunit
VRVGGSAVEIGESGLHALRAALGALAADFERGWRDLRFSGPLLARLDGVGILEPADAARLGAVGPAARASGARIDSRTTAPRLAYPAAFAPVAPPSPSGDVAARLELRALELHATFALLDGLLRAPVVPAGCEARGRPAGTGVGLVESPRGRTLCVVEAAAGRVARLHLRTGSYANWPALAHATTGALLPDFPLINKSFELCYACVDR